MFKDIGILRTILDSLLTDVLRTGLINELFSTFFAKVSAIKNVRPLVPFTTNAQNYLSLSPSLPLTQKPRKIFLSKKHLIVNTFFKGLETNTIPGWHVYATQESKVFTDTSNSAEEEMAMNLKETSAMEIFFSEKQAGSKKWLIDRGYSLDFPNLVLLTNCWTCFPATMLIQYVCL